MIHLPPDRASDQVPILVRAIKPGLDEFWSALGRQPSS